jgi:hypothetical protein
LSILVYRLRLRLTSCHSIQSQGKSWRILFAFDPSRNAILLVGGNKRGKKRWYDENIKIADRRFRRHLDRLKEQEG